VLAHLDRISTTAHKRGGLGPQEGVRISYSPRERVLRFLNELPSFVPEDLAAFFAESAEYLMVPGTPPIQGRAAIAAELERQRGTFTDLHISLSVVASDGSHVFTERVDEFTLTHNEVRASNPVTAVFAVNPEGLITGWREYWDRLALARFMGSDAQES
jgi:limonene-1,2-epoxide hydrolase